MRTNLECPLALSVGETLTEPGLLQNANTAAKSSAPTTASPKITNVVCRVQSKMWTLDNIASGVQEVNA
ncbi:MAG TPA: hypothetical protein VFF30_16915 [Nitrososphaerales archaeon]|nr:hypothetical protein [Nitrososphaerales archaeon]